MAEFQLRAMQREDWSSVARLIYSGTNQWYQDHGMGPIFACGENDALLFCEVYEALDPGCCVLAIAESGDIAGSCFYHPRSTHVSLGIMNANPEYFGQGVAKQMLRFVIEFAQSRGLPLRLVSSALNLDSFSLYSKAGFVPIAGYQDMTLAVPAIGLDRQVNSKFCVREATLADVDAMVALELEVSGIERRQDYEYFIKNELGVWHTSVLEESNHIQGFLISVCHPASNMLGPGVMRNDEQAVSLILSELNFRRGTQPVFLVPILCRNLIQQMYDLGAKNCEIHFAQSLGGFRQPNGISMPTFMPETG